MQRRLGSLSSRSKSMSESDDRPRNALLSGETSHLTKTGSVGGAFGAGFPESSLSNSFQRTSKCG